MIETSAYVALAGILITAAISDLRFRLIANRLPLLIVSLFVVAAAARVMVGVPVPTALLWPLATGVIIFLVGLAGFAAGMMGGGDVKLLAATALMAGPALAMPLVFYTALTGGLVALVLLIWQRASKSTSPFALKVPYGVAIMAGGLWVCFHKVSAVSV
ncbi:prepilin peptidase [Kordiimonas aestuarii]|uniref:prepilin peptidase n=1 Tax=Kordiimonas aestuarii TaxID=1005925 RepID=UPI0021CF416D|nr:prepilin peptidase [Kordiimonas aestuarii]